MAITFPAADSQQVPCRPVAEKWGPTVMTPMVSQSSSICKDCKRDHPWTPCSTWRSRPRICILEAAHSGRSGGPFR